MIVLLLVALLLGGGQPHEAAAAHASDAYEAPVGGRRSLLQMGAVYINSVVPQTTVAAVMPVPPAESEAIVVTPEEEKAIETLVAQFQVSRQAPFSSAQINKALAPLKDQLAEWIQNLEKCGVPGRWIKMLMEKLEELVKIIINAINNRFVLPFRVCRDLKPLSYSWLLCILKYLFPNIPDWVLRITAWLLRRILVKLLIVLTPIG
eukprot:gene2701-3001_t